MTTQARKEQANDFQSQLKALERAIADLCSDDCSLEVFYREMLERVVRVLGVGGAFWLPKEGGEFELTTHINLNAAQIQQDGGQWSLNLIALRQVMESQQPVVLPPDNMTNIYDGGVSEKIKNSSSHTLMYMPIKVEGAVEAVMTLLTPEGIDARAIRGLTAFVAGLCNQASVFVLRAGMLSQKDQLNRAERLRQFVSAIHCSLDPKRAGYALANYAQELLGVYRCMAGTFTAKGKFTIQSVSGLESVAVKSAFIKNIAIIAREVCRNNKPLIVDNPNAAIQAGTVDESGDDLVTAARLFMIEAKSLVMGVFPIRFDNHVVGALIVEKAVEEPFDKIQRKQIDTLLTEAGTAFENSLKYRTMPLALPGRALAKVRNAIYRSSKTKRLFWAAVILTVCTIPFVIYRPVKVHGTAELVAVNARSVYAQVDGRIDSVSIPADHHVEAGQVLAWLDTRMIDREIDRVSNLISENQLILAEASDRQQTTQTQRYQFALKALEAELEVYKTQRQQHAITAPVTGRIVTKETEIRKLLSKPVQRGDRILEVVPEDTQWEFLVNVPEDEAGNLLEAWASRNANGDNAKPLKARIILKSRPDLTFESQVTRVSPRAWVQTTGQHKYRNVISVHLAQPDNLLDAIEPRLGLEGNAAIEGNSRSLFYLLTHEFADYIRVGTF